MLGNGPRMIAASIHVPFRLSLFLKGCSVEIEKRGLDFVSDTPELCEDFLICPCRFCRITEPKVKPMLHVAEKDRTGLLCVIADSDHVVEGFVEEQINAFRAVDANVDTDFLHHPHGIRVHLPGGFCPRRFDAQ